MNVGSRCITTPQGERWRVGRVWVDRRLPRWRRIRFGDSASDAGWLIPDAPDEGIVAWLAIIVGTIVVAVVLIPLLLFGIELVLLGVVAALAILGRALLGRPWLVRARSLDGAEPPVAWRVVGWRRSRRVIGEVADALVAGTDPRPRAIESAAAEGPDPFGSGS